MELMLKSFTFILKEIILLFQTIIFCIYTPLLSLDEYDILHFDIKHVL